MSNILFAHADLSDSASLDASTVNAAYPLANLQNMQPSIVFRSTSVSGFTLDVDRGAMGDVDFWALVNCNFTAAATIQVKTADTQSNLSASPSYDSGVLPFTAPVGYANRAFYLKKPTAVNSRWDRFLIEDAGNSAGFLEIGRLVVAKAFVPTRNYNYGAGIGYIDNSEISESLGGQIYVNSRPRRKYLEFEIGYTKTDGMGTALELDRARGYSKDILVMQDPDDSFYIHQRSVYGLMRELAPIIHSSNNFFTKRYRVEEIL